MTEFLVAKIAVSGANYDFDNEYDYVVPPSIAPEAEVGKRVLVQFGRGRGRRLGIVLDIYKTEKYNPKLKGILSFADDEPILNAEGLKLLYWLKENTFCTYFDALRTMVPSGYGYNLTEHYVLSKSAVEDELTEAEQRILDEFLSFTEQRQRDELMSRPRHKAVKIAVNGLIDKGVIELEGTLKRRVGDETLTVVRLSNAFLDAEIGCDFTRKQRAVVELLAECETASINEIMYMTGVSRDIVKRLVRKGICEEFKVEVLRTPDVSDIRRERVEDIELDDAQKQVFDGITELVLKDKPCGALLHGVTGSGKTLVFIKLIAEVLGLGKTALMLVPEISLTPQTVKRFKSLFGETVAVMHSSLSMGQRVDEFKRIRQGKAKIVIGTRSAVFAPLENIGIIIIDEEGESTYKSESSPRYHARDVAIQRCGYHNAVMLLASATPSVESYYFAKSGRFHLFELPHRHNKTALPKTTVVDMKAEADNGNTSLFSRTLIDGVNENLKRGEQSIILLNRRGFNTYVSCLDCRTPVECPNCSIPLTYHRQNGRLMCHYCGYSRSFPKTCDKCGSTHIRASGVGTQRAEDEAARLFPDARILRMDADTTTSRYAYEKSFSAFSNKEYDIMLGTQMIAKGLDFENVTLVGVLSLDRSLYTGGFKSYERTFSLLTQVIGRCGRGSKAGRAVIQTFSPEHYIIELASKQDYKEFFEGEIELRRALAYPPFSDVCVLGFSSEISGLAAAAADDFVEILKENIKRLDFKLPLRVLGPAPCAMPRINGRYRYRIILKSKNVSAFRRLVSESVKQAYARRIFVKVAVTVDMNGDTGV